MKKRSYQIFRNQQKRAEELNLWLDYNVIEFRLLVNTALANGKCPYCIEMLTAENFGADHKTPVARGGSMHMSNLTICCMNCNKIKGPLDHIEYKELRKAIEHWNPAIQKNLYARIKMGSRHAQLRQQTSQTE